ncbi:MAG: ATP-binding cassette domain-containing protein, partial [Actinomycetota bacterium]
GAFVLSIAVAGLGGSLFAALKLGIAPDSFNLELSFLILAAVVLGGERTLRGGVVGGALAAALPEIVRFGPLEIFSGERLPFLFGAGLVLILAFRPQGLLGPKRRAGSAPTARRPSATKATQRHAIVARGARRGGPAVLRAQGVTVHFGGVQALDEVDIWVPQSEICAVIGPNGAGKTTLFNCLSGVVRPYSGRVYLAGDDITDMPPHRRAQLGLGRTFQSIELFEDFTARENLMIAAHPKRTAGPLTEALGLPGARRSEEELARLAEATLSRLGIAHLAEARPAELSSADLRRLEIGSVLVRAPKVVLLDEPTAGLDPEESGAIASLIAELRDERDLTVVLVEHDMAVVGAIAEWVYVLDFGRVIADASPNDVRRDPVVVDRYLGVPHQQEAHARNA